MNNTSARRFAVCQLGARMHYAVPRILHEHGMLERLYTDLCAAKGWPRAFARLPRRIRPRAVARLIARVPANVPASRIACLETFGLAYACRRAAVRTASDYTAVHLWAGRRFCERVIHQGLHGASGVYAFNSAALELLQHARRNGLAGVLEQTLAPAEIEDRILREEHERFPHWEPAQDLHRPEFIVRERAEWDAAGTILCGSEFVRSGIAQCGGPAGRCVVVPYGVDRQTPPAVRLAHDPIRVLTAGAVCLRKGAPYLLEAAKLLGGRAQFRFTGPIAVSAEAAHALARHIHMTGPVPRSEMTRHYEWADVFLLPTLCEGSATVCYEALAAGLPVITTPNAGSPIRDGIDGFLVPLRDPQAIAECIDRLLADPALLPELSSNAIERARDFTVARYAARLIAAL
jgi:glycosyltransferase involved in cell wall biosynthesis